MSGFAIGQGFQVYQGSNAWGNYPGDDALGGSYLMYQGPGSETLTEFIMEADVLLHDNDGIGFVFGFQDINDHFTATEINDIWPSPAADGYEGPFQKIHKRTGKLPGQGSCGTYSRTTESWSGLNCGGSIIDTGPCKKLVSVPTGFNACIAAGLISPFLQTF